MGTTVCVAACVLELKGTKKHGNEWQLAVRLRRKVLLCYILVRVYGISLLHSSVCILATHPWQHIHVDYTGTFMGSMYLVMVDPMPS